MTARGKEPKPAKVTITAASLATAITAVLPFAGTDDTLPMLAAVRCEVMNGELWLATTDRYTVGAHRVALHPDYPQSDDFAVTLPLSVAKQALAIVKLGQSEFKGIETVVTLEVEDRHVRVTAGMDTHLLKGRASEDAFPQWRHFFAAPAKDDAVTDRFFAFNPALLARFGKIGGGKTATMTCYMQSATKPMMVQIGDDFFGVVMPVRSPEGRTHGGVMRDALPGWVGGSTSVEPAVTPTIRNPIILGGKTYHRVTCKSIKGDQRVITASEAIENDDWAPCSVCNPPTSTETTA